MKLSSLRTLLVRSGGVCFLSIIQLIDPGPNRKGFFLDSTSADTVFGLLVVSNAILVGLQVDIGDETPTSLVIIENAFVAIYCAECIAWLFHLGRLYFRSVSRLLDFGIVCISVVDAWILSPLGSSSDLKFMKVLRLVRLVRVLRVIRIFRFFAELSAIVRAFTVSVDVIGWTLFLLLLITYVYAMIFLSVMDFLIVGPSPVFEEYFGSIFGASFTLFQLMTLSNNHEQIFRPLMLEVQYPFVPYLLLQLFVLITRYGLLTTALGVFVLNVHENERVRQKTKSEASLGEVEKFAQSVSVLFPLRDGKINLPCFTVGCSDPRVVAQLRRLDLHWLHPIYFFHLLDSERKGFLTVSELTARIVAVKRGAPLLAMQAISDQVSVVSLKLAHLQQRAEELSVDEGRNNLRALKNACMHFLETAKDDVVRKRLSGHITPYS